MEWALDAAVLKGNRDERISTEWIEELAYMKGMLKSGLNKFEEMRHKVYA